MHQEECIAQAAEQKHVGTRFIGISYEKKVYARVCAAYLRRPAVPGMRPKCFVKADRTLLHAGVCYRTDITSVSRKVLGRVRSAQHRFKHGLGGGCRRAQGSGRTQCVALQMLLLE